LYAIYSKKMQQNRIMHVSSLKFGSEFYFLIKYELIRYLFSSITCSSRKISNDPEISFIREEFYLKLKR